jgi:small nuclear ribonucleoprotein D3
MSLGVPLKIMHEAVHHVVTVELKSGETFTGYMAEAEVAFNSL